MRDILLLITVLMCVRAYAAPERIAYGDSEFERQAVSFLIEAACRLDKKFLEKTEAEAIMADVPRGSGLWKQCSFYMDFANYRFFFFSKPDSRQPTGIGNAVIYNKDTGAVAVLLMAKS